MPNFVATGGTTHLCTGVTATNFFCNSPTEKAVHFNHFVTALNPSLSSTNFILKKTEKLIPYLTTHIKISMANSNPLKIKCKVYHGLVLCPSCVPAQARVKQK